MKCRQCGAEVPEGYGFCGQCGSAFKEESGQKDYDRALKSFDTPALNPNTLGGYLQSEAAKKAFEDIMELFKQLVSESGKGFRVSLWVFAITLGVAILAVVILGLTHTLTSSVATVFGVLIGYVLAKMPGTGGASSNKQS